MKYISHNPSQTTELAQQFVEQLNKTSLVLLKGELGAGKTTFVKGIAQSLGVQEVVNSPTFIIMNVYEAHHSRFKRLVHVDLYRLESVVLNQVRELGVQEYIDDQETLVVIEWPERMEQPSQDVVVVRFEHDDTGRIITY